MYYIFARLHHLWLNWDSFSCEKNGQLPWFVIAYRNLNKQNGSWCQPSHNRNQSSGCPISRSTSFTWKWKMVSIWIAAFCSTRSCGLHRPKLNTNICSIFDVFVELCQPIEPINQINGIDTTTSIRIQWTILLFYFHRTRLMFGNGIISRCATEILKLLNKIKNWPLCQLWMVIRAVICLWQWGISLHVLNYIITLSFGAISTIRARFTYSGIVSWFCMWHVQSYIVREMTYSLQIMSRDRHTDAFWYYSFCWAVIIIPFDARFAWMNHTKLVALVFIAIIGVCCLSRFHFKAW